MDYEEGLTIDERSFAHESSLNKDGSKNSSLLEQASSPSSFTLKFITWNILGCEREYLKARTEAVCKTIEEEQADIVFLQEVVPETANYISERLPIYYCCFADENETDKENGTSKADGDKENEKDGEDKGELYFVGTLLKKSSVYFIDDQVIDYPLSEMTRNLLKINVKYKNLPICLLNSHLESRFGGSVQRKDQLRIVFREMLDAPDNETVIFGGDTNLREKELTEIGGLPDGIEDVWVACGSQKRYAYTFDMSLNDNLKVNWKFKPRCRYDRVYIRRSSPSRFKPVSFELIGLERLVPYGCFPSDHWGILCHFEKDDFKFHLDKGFSHNRDEAQILQPYWMRMKKSQMQVINRTEL